MTPGEFLAMLDSATVAQQIAIAAKLESLLAAWTVPTRRGPTEGAPGPQGDRSARPKSAKEKR